MEGCTDKDFPGFQSLTPTQDFGISRNRPLSRLQKRAPRPLQIKPGDCSIEGKGTANSVVGTVGGSLSTTTTTTTTTTASYFGSNDPIPFLSPLVLPSMLESPGIHQENVAKSH